MAVFNQGQTDAKLNILSPHIAFQERFDCVVEDVEVDLARRFQFGPRYGQQPISIL